MAPLLLELRCMVVLLDLELDLLLLGIDAIILLILVLYGLAEEMDFVLDLGNVVAEEETCASQRPKSG